MDNSLQLEWRTERRRVNDLLPLAINPRKMSERQREALRRSLEKFGLVEIPAINSDGTLLAGHQRCQGLQMLGRGEEEIDVRVPNRPLTDKEVKEYNIASNAIKGDWLEQVLEEHFSDIDLSEVGLDLEAAEAALAAEAAGNPQNAAEPQLPITRKFSEKYSAFIIITDNDIDENHLREILQIEPERCYKASTSVGNPHVVDAKRFFALWKSR